MQGQISRRGFDFYQLIQINNRQYCMKQSKILYKITYNFDSNKHLWKKENLDATVNSSTLQLVSVMFEISVVSRISWLHCVLLVSRPSLCEQHPATPDSPSPAQTELHETAAHMYIFYMYIKIPRFKENQKVKWQKPLATLVICSTTLSCFFSNDRSRLFS